MTKGYLKDKLNENYTCIEACSYYNSYKCIDILLDLKANTNQLEVDFIISKLREFRESWIKQSVWIITPHTEQASLLTAKISSLEDHEYYFSDLKLKIMTFDTCQWEERDYIFYSMVASEAKDRLAWIFLKSFATQNEGACKWDIHVTECGVRALHCASP
mgnify:CR=1 FL=1